MVPGCLDLISCDEHDELENNGPLVGGAMGKHHFCPNDAAHAHQLASGTYEIRLINDCRFSMKR